MASYAFSDPMIGLKPSAIREILKYSSDPEVVPLSAGNPAPEAFPVDKIAQLSAQLLAERPIDALQYNQTEGDPRLRTAVKDYMRSHHSVGTDQDEVLITAGAQQALELLAKVLLNRGDVVLCESPSFVGALNAFRSLGAQLIGIPVEEDGIDTDALEAAMKAYPQAKFLYTIPNFQNPSGVTMSLEKRRRVYELARQYGVLIAEDNPYGDLRFAGKPVPAIKSMDEEGLVVYVGSFSKVLAPGIRVGYAIAPAPVLSKMVVCKQGEDVHTAMWPQMICEAFLTDPGYDDHLERLRSLYRDKAKRLLELVDRHLVPHGVTYPSIQGGLFLWCQLPEGIDMRSFCTRAVKEYKVAVVPGNAFLTDDNAPCRAFRINFSTPTDAAMQAGIEKLEQLLVRCRREA